MYRINEFCNNIEIHIKINNMKWGLKNINDQHNASNKDLSEGKLSNLLLKFGLTWTLLPYFGEWKE